MSTAAQPTPLKGETTIVEPSRAEGAAARRAAEVRATIPDLALSAEVDAEGLLAAAQDHAHGVSAALARACALALRAHPRANAAYRDGRYELYGRVNVAVALPAPDGWQSPVLHDADRHSLDDLAREIERLAARARAGELTPPELAGATFTLTDLGRFAVTGGAPLLAGGQAAALAAGAVQPAPVVRDGAVTAGHRITLTLACDARILPAPLAADFLGAIGAELTASP
ncbi:MAG TPA: 2-oxo acid dehydrogenase subunit E2 [Solirubrobacteraceae bacterium]|nr:2-oxo acid dehydrogenase subunit E2 [Solirubrobacteraceae bacterium]